MVARRSAVSRANWCSKCGVIKNSGKRSCCARGGAWFKNCGDKQFDYTWAEGIQACEGFANTVLLEAPLQVIFRHVGAAVHPLNTAHPLGTNHQQTRMSLLDGKTNAEDYEDCAGRVYASIWICGLYLMSHLEMRFYFSEKYIN